MRFFVEIAPLVLARPSARALQARYDHALARDYICGIVNRKSLTAQMTAPALAQFFLLLKKRSYFQFFYRMVFVSSRFGFLDFTFVEDSALLHHRFERRFVTTVALCNS